MKYALPAKLSITKILNSFLPSIAAGGVTYYFLESVAFSICTFAVIFLSLPLIKGWRSNNSYKNHIAKFGYDFSAEYTPEIYEASIYGFVPSTNRYINCSVYVDEKGIIISKKSVKRCIPWDLVVGSRIHNNERSKYIELNVKDLSTDNRLLIPWASEFSCFLPKNS